MTINSAELLGLEKQHYRIVEKIGAEGARFIWLRIQNSNIRLPRSQEFPR
jgi:hypothetical protein